MFCDDTFHHEHRLLVLLSRRRCCCCSSVYLLARHFFRCASVATFVSMIQCNIDNVYKMLSIWCVPVATGPHHIWRICVTNCWFTFMLRFYFSFSLRTLLLCSFSFADFVGQSNDDHIVILTFHQPAGQCYTSLTALWLLTFSPHNTTLWYTNSEWMYK